MPILILNDKLLMTSQNKALSYTGEYPDGDEMEFGDSQQLTDLTGTSWYFNAQIDVSTPAAYNVTFYWQSSLSQKNRQGMTITYNQASESESRFNHINQGAYETAYIDYNDGITHYWNYEEERTITFTGGTDATNTNLISWIQANATQLS